MGYRSNVVYAIAGPVDRMIAFITAAKLTDSGHANAIAELKLLEHGDKALVLVGNFENVKWYENYPDVMTHAAFWDYADCSHEDFQLRGSFCRTGEEDDDTESKYFGDDGYELVCVRREIVIGFDINAPERKAP